MKAIRVPGESALWVGRDLRARHLFEKSRSDGTMVARGFSPWTQCEFRVRRSATPESIACNSS
jgi:hypothetical protein